MTATATAPPRYRARVPIVNAAQFFNDTDSINSFPVRLGSERNPGEAERFFVVDQDGKRLYLQTGNWVVYEGHSNRVEVWSAAQFQVEYERVVD
jgi:hypothetical protein